MRSKAEARAGSGARATTAIEFAIGVVAARSLPEKKLREKIAARYPADETDAAMDRLRELRLVDDAAWAERFATDRIERGGKGRHRIRGELLLRGIDAETADAAIATVAVAETEREKAASLLASLRGRLGSRAARDAERRDARADLRGATASARGANAEETLKNRLFRRMLARGYPASLVRDLLDRS